MQTSLKYRILNTGLPPTPLSVVHQYLSPLLENAPKTVKLEESKSPLKKGEPILAFCASGGTEAGFLKLALENPESPAVILVHKKANSFAAGCEISSRLTQEFKRGNRVPAIFVNVEDKKRVDAILRAASVASSFAQNPPKIGIIGEPSDWLIGSGKYAKGLPEQFGIKSEQIPIETLVRKVKEENKDIYHSLREIIDEHSLNAFTIRCFDLLSSLKTTSCLEVSRLNDENVISSCEGDIPATITMMIMQKMTGSPVFMANPTSVELDKDVARFAHCTIPKRLCTSSVVKTHFESGIGHAIAGKVREGIWTIARFGVDKSVMTTKCEVRNPDTLSPDQCRTQIIANISHDFASKLRNGEVLGNHVLFVPGDIQQSLEIYSKYFLKWNKINK
jgi:L-fucose isomerase-like protein